MRQARSACISLALGRCVVAALAADRDPYRVASLISVEGNFPLADAFWSAKVARMTADLQTLRAVFGRTVVYLVAGEHSLGHDEHFVVGERDVERLPCRRARTPRSSWHRFPVLRSEPEHNSPDRIEE